MNIVRVLLGVSVLNGKHWLHLGLEEVLYAHTFKQHNLGKYYFVANAKSLHLVTNWSNTSKNKPQGNVLLFGAWGCARDPMLQEFPVNTNPTAGDESKTHSFLIHFSDMIFYYNCLFLFKKMEILPNLYFADFYIRNGNSSKYTEAISGQVAG